MAVAYDAASNSGALTGVASTSWSHTCTGSDRALFVGTGNSSGGGGALTTSITYGGVSMTELWDVNGQQGFIGNSGYVLAAPASGSNTVGVTWAATADEVAAQAISATGVNQGTPTGTVPTTATGTSSTASVTVTAAADDLVVDNAYVASTAINVGAGQTQRNNVGNIGSFSSLAGSTEPGAASVTMTWTWTGGAEWATNGVALKAAAGGGATIYNRKIFDSPIFTSRIIQ